MGIRANFSVREVSSNIKNREKLGMIALKNSMERSSKEFASVIKDLVPYKTGTLQRSIRRKSEKYGEWTVYMNLDQKVPNRPVTVGDYIGKIEAGDFDRLGKRSLEKESFTDKSRLAGLRVETWRGTYVGGEFWYRTEKALLPKWQKRWAKALKEAVERGPDRFKRDAGGRFA